MEHSIIELVRLEFTGTRLERMKYNASLQWTEIYNSTEWEAFTSPEGALTRLVGLMNHSGSATLKRSWTQYLRRMPQTKPLNLKQRLDHELEIRLYYTAEMKPTLASKQVMQPQGIPGGT